MTEIPRSWGGASSPGAPTTKGQEGEETKSVVWRLEVRWRRGALGRGELSWAEWGS